MEKLLARFDGLRTFSIIQREEGEGLFSCFYFSTNYNNSNGAHVSFYCTMRRTLAVVTALVYLERCARILRSIRVVLSRRVRV